MQCKEDTENFFNDDDYMNGIFGKPCSYDGRYDVSPDSEVSDSCSAETTDPSQLNEDEQQAVPAENTIVSNAPEPPELSSCRADTIINDVKQAIRDNKALISFNVAKENKEESKRITKISNVLDFAVHKFLNISDGSLYFVLTGKQLLNEYPLEELTKRISFLLEQKLLPSADATSIIEDMACVLTFEDIAWLCNELSNVDINLVAFLLCQMNLTCDIDPLKNSIKVKFSKVKSRKSKA